MEKRKKSVQCKVKKRTREFNVGAKAYAKRDKERPNPTWNKGRGALGKSPQPVMLPT